MAGKGDKRATVEINRAPVSTLWAAVVAQRRGFNWDEASTLGRAVAGLNAYSKGVSLGLFKPSAKEIKEKRRKLRPAQTVTVDLLHRAVPAVRTENGLRALGRNRPIAPENVQRYLFAEFGARLDEVQRATTTLAKSMTPVRVGVEAYDLYGQFRPAVPAGQKGWGAAGTLSLAKIRRLAG